MRTFETIGRVSGGLGYIPAFSFAYDPKGSATLQFAPQVTSPTPQSKVSAAVTAPGFDTGAPFLLPTQIGARQRLAQAQASSQQAQTAEVVASPTMALPLGLKPLHVGIAVAAVAAIWWWKKR